MSTPNPSPNGPRFEPLWRWKTCVLCSDAQESPTGPNLSMLLPDPLIDDGSSFLRAASGTWSSSPCSSAGNTSSLLPTIQKRLAARDLDPNRCPGALRHSIAGVDKANALRLPRQSSVLRLDCVICQALAEKKLGGQRLWLISTSTASTNSLPVPPSNPTPMVAMRACSGTAMRPVSCFQSLVSSHGPSEPWPTGTLFSSQKLRMSRGCCSATTPRLASSERTHTRASNSLTCLPSTPNACSDWHARPGTLLVNDKQWPSGPLWPARSQGTTLHERT